MLLKYNKLDMVKKNVWLCTFKTELSESSNI